jgi:hypothetical protein
MNEKGSWLMVFVGVGPCAAMCPRAPPRKLNPTFPNMVFVRVGPCAAVRHPR